MATAGISQIITGEALQVPEGQQDAAQTQQVVSPLEKFSQVAQQKQKSILDTNEVLDKKKLGTLVEKLNKTMDIFDIQARFSIHEQTKDIMVRIMDIKQNKILREIPSQKILDMVAKMMEMVGLLVDEKA